MALLKQHKFNTITVLKECLTTAIADHGAKGWLVEKGRGAIPLWSHYSQYRTAEYYPKYMKEMITLVCHLIYLCSCCWQVAYVRGPPISAHLRVQLWSISTQLRSKHATLVVAMQLRTPCATLITSKNPPPQHQPRYTHLAYLLYSPFPRLSGIYSCHP